MAGKILNKIDNVIDFSKNPDLLEEELSELIEDKNSIGLLEEKASISQKRVMKLIEKCSKDFVKAKFQLRLNLWSWGLEILKGNTS